MGLVPGGGELKMRYKNPDPFELKKAEEIIARIIASCDETILDCVKRNFH